MNTYLCSRLKTRCQQWFLSGNKDSQKIRENVAGLVYILIHYRQIHAHKWSNKMNSRLKTGCEHGFPIAGDET